MLTRVLALSRRRTATLLGGALLAIYLATATWDMVQVTDTRSTAAAAWGLGTTGSVALPDTWEDLPWRAVTSDGTVVSNRLPGATVWGAIFYAVLPTPTQVDRTFDVPVYPAAIAAATSAALAMAVLFLALDRLVDDRRLSLGGALVFALGTGTWSISSDALWTHGPTQLALALALLALSHERQWLAGLALGAAMFARPQVGAAAALIGLGLAWSARSLWPAVRIGLASFPGFAGLVIWSRVLFDTWQPIGGYRYGSIQSAVTNVVGLSPSGGAGPPPRVFNLALVLAHPLRGVLVYSPWLILCIPGLRKGWRVAPPWVRWAAVGGVGAILLQLGVQPAWHGGDYQFGYRLPLEWLTLSAPLLLLAWREGVQPLRIGRILTAVFAGASILVFAAGSTFLDPRNAARADFLEMVDELGPHGEGWKPGDAYGVDLSGGEP